MARQNFRYQKKEKLWVGVGSSHHAFTTAAVQTGSAFQFTSPQTILRILGEYIIGPTSVPAALDEAFVTVAIGVFSSDAFTLGESAMPDPVTEEGYPWLYWRQHAFFFDEAVVDPSSAMGSVRTVVDVKSMRKVTANQSLGVVVQYVNEVGSPPLHVTFAGTRVLTTVH